ncbi:tRNA (adenosine(37)-N6)-threonylcarbamoyltransferase complex ATPase subunit type 1 TsaE [Alkalibacillus haloalkaliphilus]|uniref:tRNA (adenosine(37)-N6)-threonylcarbamoyltransferase complex ATPase subunit type 1 TsaE n=1 Tax=Alkalibacillus haloalkaliphilus TaxID=94136 RepID=UPI00293563DE|nr:tRNA (adenosine(37)-N6)-threonylcarbamoyltransferase complex ATPase subunit type 1 TsaE [Alkalibacillus haloalkaliphilus]MDV2583501.1 tRNA (adenosine(37)-N6)-threonylcarbamoyltransferase complex ATPase subunit type 1 TsaE [Alkalibacillus haloalkaliphilus]
MYKFTTINENETQRLAKQIGEKLMPNDVLTLDGDLGAGKTTFTKGLAEGLAVKRTVNSPTFTIVKEYKGRMPLYHMDVYRLEDSEEDIGFDDYFNAEGVTVIEWSQFILEFLPEERLQINIEKIDEERREIILTPHSDHLNELCKELKL